MMMIEECKDWVVCWGPFVTGSAFIQYDVLVDAIYSKG